MKIFYVFFTLISLTNLQNQTKMEQNLINNCTDTLNQIRNLEINNLHGLPLNCEMSTIREVFEVQANAILMDLKVGGALFKRLKAPESATAPYGYSIWFQQGKMAAIGIVNPEFDESLIKHFIENGTKINSGIGSFVDQYVLAEKGISAHISKDYKNVRRVYFLPSMSQEEFENYSFSKVSVTRRRR